MVSIVIAHFDVPFRKCEKKHYFTLTQFNAISIRVWIMQYKWIVNKCSLISVGDKINLLGIWMKIWMKWLNLEPKSLIIIKFGWKFGYNHTNLGDYCNIWDGWWKVGNTINHIRIISPNILWTSIIAYLVKSHNSKISMRQCY